MVEEENRNDFRGIRILFVTTISRTIKAFLLPYVSALSGRGAVVDAMCSSSNKEIEKYFRKVWYVKFTRSPILALLYLPVLINRIRKIVINEKYDIVHVHTPIASFITRISMALIEEQKRPTVIYTAHGFHFHPLGNKISNALFRGLEKLAAKYTDYLITINEWDYRMAIEHNFLPENRIFYIEGIGIDAIIYDPDKVSQEEVKDFKNEIYCDENTKLFCVIGEFIPRKRHVDIIKAFKSLEEELAVKPFKIAMVGDGRLRKKIKRKAEQLGVIDKVIFLGYRNDIPLILRASDAMILASIREGMPRVVMEAMAMKTPVIANEIRGVIDLLSGGYGILVKPKSAKDLSNAIKWVINNPEEAKTMAIKAREKIINEHDIRVVLPQHIEVYKQAIFKRRHETEEKN
jgi:glycosyltransferase involved in cell wall biosynthesis